MADTLTLILDGTVTLDDFAKAIEHFRTLVGSLSAEVAGDAAIEWVVNDLQSSSAIATIKGNGPEAPVDRVVAAYEEIGEAMQRRKPFPFTRRVQKPVDSLLALIDGKIESIRFETPRRDAIIGRRGEPFALVESRPDWADANAYGAVEGVVEALSRRRGLRFTLYDALHDKAVSCYLSPGSEDIMRDAWGNRTVVYGRVRRDPASGRALAVRDITKVTRVQEGRRGDWREARGAYLPADDVPSPEDRIRALRDG